MSDFELEPLPEDVEALLQASAPPALPPGVADAIWLKVAKSAGALPGGAGAVASTSLAAKLIVPVVTLVIGVVLGVVVDRAVLNEPAAVPEVEIILPPPPPPEVKPPAPLVAPVAPAAPARKPVKPVDTLGRERVLLDAARLALQQRESGRALAMIDVHAREFPRGQLVEEREVLAIQALVGAGKKPEARLRLDAFALRHPDSPLLDPLRSLVK